MRLIDADALLKNIESEINKKTKVILLADYNHYYCSGMRNAIRLVKRLPTVEPVKHGHWIHVDELPSGDYFKCSECNHEIYLKHGWKVSFESPADKYKYCPNCGTRMENNAND